ncbi:MAG TPA: hypothetical protein DGT21_00690 [Armatimonadetes bacterium]|jgi:protein phosphatase|nr:hypothetical protein [Armatimonadota bacterium]
MEGVGPQIRVATATTMGQRPENQDAAIALRLDPTQSCWGFEAVVAVADGMGGHSAGGVASRIAADTIAELLGKTHLQAEADPVPEDLAEPADAVAHAVSVANARIHQQAEDHPAQHDMGTTLTLVAITADAAIVAHVGDSRGYLLSLTGIVQITQDHTWVAQQVRAERMTEEEAARSPLRSQITRTLGAETEAEPDIVAIPLEVGSAFVVCSDGLVEVVSPPRIEHALRSEPDIATACQRLVEAAEVGGASDNATVACVEIGDVNRAVVPQTPASEMTDELYPAVRSRARGHDDRMLRRLRPLIVAVIALVGISLLLLVRSCVLAPGRQAGVEDPTRQPIHASAFDLPPVEEGLVVRIAVVEGTLIAGANRHVQLTIHEPGDSTREEPKTVIGPEGDYTRTLSEQQAAKWKDAACQLRIWAEGDGIHFETDPKDLEVFVNKKALTSSRVSSAAVSDDSMRVGFYFPANNRDAFTVALTRIDAANLPRPNKAGTN